MKLPKVDYWFEPIDASAVAVFAQRRYDDAPRYTAFMIFDVSKVYRSQMRAEVLTKLEDLEQRLYKKYGRGFFRQWQYWFAHGVFE